MTFLAVMQKEQDNLQYLYYKLSQGDIAKEYKLRAMGIVEFFKFIEFGNRYNKELTAER